MASTYSTNLKIELIGTGEQAGTWGVTTNTNLGTALEQAIVGKADVSMSSTTVTLTLTNSNAAQDARAIYLNLTGSPGGAADLVVPAVEKPYIVKNGSDQVVTVKVSGQTGVAVPVGKTMWLYNNGTDVTNAIDNLPSGATVGGVAIGTTSGTVTSVAGTGTVNGISLSGTVTSSGNITLGGTLANVDLTSQVTGTLPVANGGTGITSFGTGVATFLGTPSSSNLAAALTDETGSGLAVFNANPLFTTLRETTTVSATAASSTVNFDAITQSVLYYTSDATGDWTLNVRGDSGTSLDSIMSTGQSLTIAFLVTNGATPYYQTGFEIDGSSVTPEWQGGSAPSSGNASSIDVYSITIIKTASATFTVLAAQTQFA